MSLWIDVPMDRCLMDRCRLPPRVLEPLILASKIDMSRWSASFKRNILRGKTQIRISGQIGLEFAKYQELCLFSIDRIFCDQIAWRCD